MKEYFTKYLPVEGEIKFNDYYYSVVMDKVNHYLEIRKDLTAPNPEDKKVKLFLCSRDIQVGDEITHLGGLKERINSKEYLEKCQIFFKTNEAFKIIGEISIGATWVKEGNEFDEDEIQKLANLSSTFHTNYEPWIEGREKQGYKCLILIKGPCGHFH